MLLKSFVSISYDGLLWVLGIRILRLRERARRSTAPPTAPPSSFLEVRPSMLPLYHMTQPARENSTSRAPVYTSRSPKSLPWISRGAKTPSSRDVTPNRSISTANTRASLQWDRPSYLCTMAALTEKRMSWNVKEKYYNFTRVIILVHYHLMYNTDIFVLTCFKLAPVFSVKTSATPVTHVKRLFSFSRPSTQQLRRYECFCVRKQNPTHLPQRHQFADYYKIQIIKEGIVRFWVRRDRLLQATRPQWNLTPRHLFYLSCRSAAALTIKPHVKKLKSFFSLSFRDII